jgi:hypothetical protein
MQHRVLRSEHEEQGFGEIALPPFSGIVSLVRHLIFLDSAIQYRLNTIRQSKQAAIHLPVKLRHTRVFSHPFLNGAARLLLPQDAHAYSSGA